RAELLHPCVPGRLQRLHFLRRRLDTLLRGFAIDAQKLRHDGTPPKRKNQEPKHKNQYPPIWHLVLGSWFFLLVSHTRAEACPPHYVNTTNGLQPFGHRREKKHRGSPDRPELTGRPGDEDRSVIGHATCLRFAFSFQEVTALFTAFVSHPRLVRRVAPPPKCHPQTG